MYKKSKIEKPKNKWFTKINGSPYPITNKTICNLPSQTFLLVKPITHPIKKLIREKEIKYFFFLLNIFKKELIFKLSSKLLSSILFTIFTDITGRKYSSYQSDSFA